MLIFKILRAEEWAQLLALGETLGSALDETDGYIHFSTGVQVADTLAKHYAAEDNLVLLAFNAEPMGDLLRWERARGGAMFPHLYAPLKLSNSAWSAPIALAPNGLHILPPGVV